MAPSRSRSESSDPASSETAGSDPADPEAESACTGEVVLAIPALTEYVSLVRLVVSSAVQVHPCIDPDRIEDLQVAVSEATTNAIRSHESSGTNAQIRVTCNVAEDHIEVIIRDYGEGFDPDALPVLPEPGSPERLLHESGMGLRLMRMLADETEIYPSSSGTCVRLVFHGTKRHRAVMGR
ncbi:MAG: ATP-binding protein [Acidimicrobiaceae bacterium]|nr:ATP-binding protein [Acidimicrobiaceae bacterium]MDE0606805.1 ATP-binding protein [Acidimicrobiaceae bacterium]